MGYDSHDESGSYRSKELQGDTLNGLRFSLRGQ